MKRFHYLLLWALATALAMAVGLLAVSVVGDQIRSHTASDLLESALLIETQTIAVQGAAPTPAP